jgi:hypothetical protein
MVWSSNVNIQIKLSSACCNNCHAIPAAALFECRVPYSFFPARGSPIVSRDQIISTGCREAQNKHIQASVLLRRHSSCSVIKHFPEKPCRLFQ